MFASNEGPRVLRVIRMLVVDSVLVGDVPVDSVGAVPRTAPRADLHQQYRLNLRVFLIFEEPVLDL